MGNDEFGMRCVPSPGCTPTPCHGSDIFGGSISHCTNVENQFKIIRPVRSQKIYVGDTVLLRSVYKPSMWLNCSGINRECVISSCTSNAVDPSNSSYISTCEEHMFTIRAGNRKIGKVVTTKQKIQIKSNKDNSYLNCLGKKCEMIEDGACPKDNDATQNLINEIKKGETCKPLSYNFTILS